ncbi:cytochrome d ubiquinol oxidase subunit II [Fodinicola feengrottensis]|uniref:cytochrome d ubiquinol oxidase subunit II n=1 Tax=Fodinicola feengrottensis TaxID=435914 RepID=UPI0013CFCA02|nr:cytochrome d ubiquinol oxidase subunit II [Fodinicola feengrottensis]
MDVIAVALLTFFAVGYFVLAGADIGVGMVLPFLGRRPGERRLVIASFGPFFLANEVWLVGTAGLLVGFFPNLEGKLLTGLFPAVVCLLLGWICRDLGLWLRGRMNARPWWWCCDAAIVAGSWTVALSWGWIAASVLGQSSAAVASGPGTVLAALTVASLFVLHGLAYATLRLSGELRSRARALSGPAGEVRTYILTSAGLVALTVGMGFRLPLLDSAADSATLQLLVPAVVLLTHAFPAAVANPGSGWSVAAG